MIWLRKDEYVLKTKLLEQGTGLDAQEGVSVPHKLRDELVPRRNAARAVVGFRDGEDTVLNDRATAASETSWNVPLQITPRYPRGPSWTTLQTDCRAFLHC